MGVGLVLLGHKRGLRQALSWCYHVTDYNTGPCLFLRSQVGASFDCDLSGDSSSLLWSLTLQVWQGPSFEVVPILFRDLFPSQRLNQPPTRMSRPSGKLRQNLKSGRPPLSKAQPATLSSRATRAFIRSHHILQKQLSRAKATGNESRVREIEAEITAHGGLKSYQLASTLGQSRSRGGDSSKILVQWLKDDLSIARTQRLTVRVLEVGALSTANALNVPGVTTVRRIDLQSSTPGIEETDFMQLPLPSENTGEWEGQRGYHVLSLSLVLNFVSDGGGRGAMLQRTTKFFNGLTEGQKGFEPTVFPCLFLVLPLPCVANSRYLDCERLETMMGSLGYRLIKLKQSKKLFYSLWQYDPGQQENWTGPKFFKKQELAGGKNRNNFCIVLE